MAPVQFQPHSCRHCQKVVIKDIDWSWDLNANRSIQLGGGEASGKIFFVVTFQELIAAESHCALFRWILEAECISRPDIVEMTEMDVDDHYDTDSLLETEADLGLVQVLLDDLPENKHSSLRVAVQQSGVNVDDYVLAAETRPKLHSVVGDLCSISYFGLCRPRSKSITYRTVHGLELFTTDDDPAASRVSTRPIENNPLACLGEVKTWLSDCLTSHDACDIGGEGGGGVEQAQPKRRPKRLIRIQPRGVEGHVRLHLQDTSRLEPIPRFTALSYCWGGEQTFRCETGTLASLEDRIDFDMLPATIQDAATVSQGLGIEFLWVDALCILQDSEDDKIVEIAKMPDIYSGAVLAIVAARARSAWEGFLQERVRSPDAIAAFSVPWCSRDGRFGSVTAVQLESLPEPIDERGWTFQERLLSYRVLEFGTRQTKWSCRGVVLSGDLDDGLADGWRRKPDPRLRQYLPLDWHRADLSPQQSWAPLVDAYTRRKLTHDRDRPLAISGVAHRLGQLMDDQYVAGLWRSSLPDGLLWCVIGDRMPSRPRSYQGPSWSWLSVGGMVQCDFLFAWRPQPAASQEGFREDAPGFGDEDLLETSYRHAEILSVSVDPVNTLAPYGSTREGSGCLRVRGRLASAAYRPLDSSGDLELRSGLYSTNITITGKNGAGVLRTCNPRIRFDCGGDDIVEPSSDGQQGTLVALEIRSALSGVTWACEGLLLRQVARPAGIATENSKTDMVPTYMRIGVFEHEIEEDEYQGQEDEDAAHIRESIEREFNFYAGLEPQLLDIV